MSNRFGLPDSLLDAVKAVTKEDKEVRQYRAFGLTTESKNAPSKENGGIAHDCASHVHHATYGEGFCIPEQHTIVETASGEGYVTHYDVEFDDCIVEDVPVEELDIITESNHGHARKKKMEAMDPVGKEDDDIDNDGDSDASDSYLKNRRKAIKKSMGKESVKINPEIKEARGGADEPDKHIVMQLRKAQDVGGDHMISFRGGKKAKVAKKHIDNILKVHDHPSIKPDHKRKIRVAISKSPQHLATFANRLGEEFEQIDELKKSTLASYVKKASDDHLKTLGKSYRLGGLKHRHAFQPYSTADRSADKLGGKYRRQQAKRRKGIDTAVDKLAREEVELIDELKKSTLASYVKKAVDDSNINHSAVSWHRATATRSDNKRYPATNAQAKWQADQVKKRKKGIETAASKLAREDVELEEETKVDSKLENPHNCATHVYSEQWGDGKCITTMHAEPDQDGNIAWYDVFFEHGIEKGVPIEELKVVKSESHMHSKRGKK